MKFFIDSANTKEIAEIHSWGILSGVTTNPTLVAKEKVDFHQRLREITAIITDGSVSAEVIALDATGMIREGKELAAIANNITVKIPMTAEGLQAVAALSRMGIETNVTLVFSANQALLAARAGATYVSPFIGRLEDIGENALELVQGIAHCFDRHQLPTKVLAASIRTPEHVFAAAIHGAHVATIPYPIFKQLPNHKLTSQGIDQFLADWNAAKNS